MQWQKTSVAFLLALDLSHHSGAEALKMAGQVPSVDPSPRLQTEQADLIPKSPCRSALVCLGAKGSNASCSSMFCLTHNSTRPGKQRTLIENIVKWLNKPTDTWAQRLHLRHTIDNISPGRKNYCGKSGLSKAAWTKSGSQSSVHAQGKMQAPKGLRSPWVSTLGWC